MIYPIAICHCFIFSNKVRQQLIEEIGTTLQSLTSADNDKKGDDTSNKQLDILLFNPEEASSVIKVEIYSKNVPKQTSEQNKLAKTVIDKLVEKDLCHVYSFQKLEPKKKIFSRKKTLGEKLILTGSLEACFLHILNLYRLINLSEVDFNVFDFNNEIFKSYRYDEFKKLKENALKQERFVDLVKLYPFQNNEETFLKVDI